MAGRAEPRFRLKSSGGSEILLETVEDLGRRLESGGVDPNALLYDSGTGGWTRAADSPVVRFIVEELEREGRAPPGFSDPEAPRAQDGGSWVVRERPGALAESAAPEPPPSPPRPGSPAAPSPTARTQEVDGSPDGNRPSEPIERREPAGGTLHPGRSSEEARPSRPGPRRSGSPPSGGTSLLRLAGLLVLMAGALYLFVDQFLEARTPWDDGGLRRGAGTPDAPPIPPGPGAPLDSSLNPGVVAGGVVDRTPLPSPPAGLEGEVEMVRIAVERHFQLQVDSLRAELSLPAASPREWLAGPYLAGASAYLPIRDFWENYGALVEALQARDRYLYLSAVRDAVRGLPDHQIATLEGYFRDRYDALRSSRHDRYRQLVLAAQRAVELHDFLELNEDNLRYTPALGGALPSNPVLEVEPADQDTRVQFNRHLDRVLEALDRSSGPGAPPAEGLTVDLFRRFGEGWA